MSFIFNITCVLSAILCGIYFIYRHMTRHFNYWTDRGINGPKPIPVFGNVLSQFITPKPYLLLEWHQKYGKIYGTYNGNDPVLCLADPELIKQVLVKDFHIFTERRLTRTTHPIFSRHISAVKGDDWKRLRSVLSPTFTSGKMKKMYPMVRQCLHDFMDSLETYALDRQDVDLKLMFGNYTHDVIATCAFGIKTNAHKDPDNPFLQNSHKVLRAQMFKLIPLMIFPNYLLNLLGILHPSDESANEFIFDLSRRVIKERKASNKQFNDFIALLINAEKNRDEEEVLDSYHMNEDEDSKAAKLKALSNTKSRYITEDEILANTWAFFVSGYETTSTSLTFLAYELALNPEVQEKLYAEVMTYVDSKGELEYELLAKLDYLDAVITENLRLHAPTLFLSRQASEDYRLGNTGLIVPKGGRIEIPVLAIHCSDEFYENPLCFDPDRFMPDNRHKIVPYSYLPFGSGPRNCVAMRFALMEIKMALIQIVQRYKFFRSANTDVPMKLDKATILNTPRSVVCGIEKRIPG